MHTVVRSYLKTFVDEHGFSDLEESKQFEHFVNYCVVAQYYPESFDFDKVTTSDSDPSIDGIAVILGDELVTTVEDAKSLLEGKTSRRSVDARYVFTQAKRSDSFDAGEMLKFGSGVTALFGDKPRTKDDVVDEFLDIHKLLLDNLGKIQNGRPHISLFFATTGVWQEASGLRAQVLAPTTEGLRRLGLFHTIDFEPLDREGLIKLWNRSRSPVEATFSVKGAVALPPIANVTEAYLGLARASEFVDQVLSDSDGRMRASVFEQNVRAFLGDENEVNARMAEALKEATHHDRFAINNNGITIVSPDVRVQNDRVSVADFQIVNGCQTSHVLFRNRENLTDSIWVPLKVIEASDPDVVAQLVESTNSQTAIEGSQFISIRPFAQKLEAYFTALGQDDEEARLYFERRTNQYAGSSVTRLRIFDVAKLARAFAAMFLDLPHLAYMYPTQVLHQRRSDLFRPDHSEHAYYTAALALYRLELAFGNNYVPRKFQGYKWHILMLLRHLVAGPDAPRFGSGKFDKYCSAIDAVLARGGKVSAPPFLQCVELIEKTQLATRDKRKGARYTGDLIKAAVKARTKATSDAQRGEKRHTDAVARKAAGRRRTKEAKAKPGAA